jgi:hypothetical protein
MFKDRLVNDQAARRVDLERQREEAAERLAQLEVQQAGVTCERKQADADLGPVRYLATLLGSTDEATIRWFILAVASLLDPAAVLLLLAATRPSVSVSWPLATREPSGADLRRLGLSLYLAKLFGSNDVEAVVQLITALLVLDPLAVLLTLAAIAAMSECFRGFG